LDKLFLITGIFTLAIILRRAGVVREGHVAILTRYIMWLSLPCLTLTTIGSLDLKNSHFDIALIAWGVMLGGASLSFLAGRVLGLEGKSLRVFILATTFPNTGFLGYPLAYALFGATGLSYAVIYDQMGMFPIFITLGFFIAGARGNLLRSPLFLPFLALLAALFLNWAGIHFTGTISLVLRNLGWTTLPLTIFIIGLRIRPISMRDSKPVVTCLVLRMCVFPLLLFLLLHLCGKEGLPYQVTLMETAMPPALTTGILAFLYRLDEELAVACISAGTLICMLLFSITMLFR
jgi:malate permease and related proteins